MSTTIHAPWTGEQVDALNFYQVSGVMHPFTCPNHDSYHDGETVLVATPGGWRCPREACDYAQGWAHAFMADRPAMEAALDSLRDKGFKVDG